MKNFEDIAPFSALPIVDLDRIEEPRDGLLLACNDTCRSYFLSRDKCREHYERLRSRNSGDLVQCPYGFASIVLQSEGGNMALTSFVPYPRLGGSKERAVAKRHPGIRLEKRSIRAATDALQYVITTMSQQRDRLLSTVHTLEADIVQRYAMALHEVRKLNRTVKVLAERLCIGQKPEDPSSADPILVNIWKASELMSREFDVIEVLANESLTTIPLNTTSEPYKLFDKCVRIYRPEDDPDRYTISGPQGYEAKIRACDKTLPIIPTVLLDNARRYSADKTPIEVRVEPGTDHTCVVSVSNYAREDKVLDDRIFERGVRGNEDKEGSGNGLYVAQLVAKQHGTRITIENSEPERGLRRHTFRIAFETIK